MQQAFGPLIGSKSNPVIPDENITASSAYAGRAQNVRLDVGNNPKEDFWNPKDTGGRDHWLKVEFCGVKEVTCVHFKNKKTIHTSDVRVKQISLKFSVDGITWFNSDPAVLQVGDSFDIVKIPFSPVKARFAKLVILPVETKDFYVKMELLGRDAAAEEPSSAKSPVAEPSAPKSPASAAAAAPPAAAGSASAVPASPAPLAASSAAAARLLDVGDEPVEAPADAQDQELKTLVSQDHAAMREVNAKCDSAIKELEAMSAKFESTSKELKAMSTKYDSAREELEAMSAKHDSASKELEAMSAKYDSASKELERIAAAGQPANARGSALAAARAGHGAEERLAAMEAVLDELQVDAGMLKDGASFRRWMAQHGYVKEQKFEARALKFGRSTEAAAGIEALIGMDEDDLHDKARGGLAAMRAEFEANGGPEDKANFKYVVEGVAQDKQWLPDHVKADIQKGQYHGGPLEPGDYDRNHSGMTLKDFVESLEAKVSKLKEHHIAALRLYTTSSYRKLNAPFRDRAPLPHPFAVTVYFLAQGLKKLRTVQAEIDPEGFAAESTLWRGLSNATIDLEAFKREGGTELAPMSTSSDRSVAAKYAASQSPLILRYKAKGLTRGVSLKFLSVYPKEEEFLYPPGTFLSFGGVEEIDGVSIVTVEPVMA